MVVVVINTATVNIPIGTRVSFIYLVCRVLSLTKIRKVYAGKESKKTVLNHIIYFIIPY